MEGEHGSKGTDKGSHTESTDHKAAGKGQKCQGTVAAMLGSRMAQGA